MSGFVSLVVFLSRFSLDGREAGMLQTADGTMYKSRPKLLLEFFRRSRDQWKCKCKAAKAALKNAHNRNRWLETSRDQWKERARQLQGEVERLREEQKATGR